AAAWRAARSARAGLRPARTSAAGIRVTFGDRSTQISGGPARPAGFTSLTISYRDDDRSCPAGSTSASGRDVEARPVLARRVLEGDVDVRHAERVQTLEDGRPLHPVRIGTAGTAEAWHLHAVQVFLSVRSVFEAFVLLLKDMGESGVRPGQLPDECRVIVVRPEDDRLGPPADQREQLGGGALLIQNAAGIDDVEVPVGEAQILDEVAALIEHPPQAAQHRCAKAIPK